MFAGSVTGGMPGSGWDRSAIGLTTCHFDADCTVCPAGVPGCAEVARCEASGCCVAVPAALPESVRTRAATPIPAAAITATRMRQPNQISRLPLRPAGLPELCMPNPLRAPASASLAALPPLAPHTPFPASIAYLAQCDCPPTVPQGRM